MTSPEATLPAGDGAAPKNEPVPSAIDRFAGAFVDRLNPILVREVRQAMNGKAFVITGALALLGTILIALTAAAGGKAVGRGAYVFVYALQILTPIVLFIVPLQAFLSTRHEVSKGTVEHLLLSRLTPGQIVRGKLAAACIQFVLYLAIFAPLIAMTFLLRGVDVPTIAFSIGMAILFGLGCSALAVACGSLSRWPALFRVLPFAVVIFGLGILTVSVMGGMSAVLFEITREIFRGDFWEITSAIVIPTVAGTVLCGLVGTAALSHPYENRSTGFRIFAVVAVVGAFVWMYLVLVPTSSSFLRPGRMLWELSAVVAGFLFVFPLFAVTEAPRLSPRVRMHVPRNGLLALLSAPFLPGSGRGFLYTLLFTGTALALPILFARIGGHANDGKRVGFALMAWCYVVFYAGLAAFVRRRLGPSPKATWLARAVPVVVLLLSLILPLLFEVVLGADRIGRWHIYRALDPFTTFEHFDGHPRSAWDVLPGLGLLALLTIALNVPAMVSGMVEVRRASKARRRLEH